ncbi:hypothetical protein MED121_02850 [Marinomonas sp. MED121]|nr:hypothetical protein MED121_02850 [Marinomonas sp. MED121]
MTLLSHDHLIGMALLKYVGKALVGPNGLNWVAQPLTF